MNRLQQIPGVLTGRARLGLRPRSLRLSLGLACTIFPTASAGAAFASSGFAPHTPSHGAMPLSHSPSAHAPWGQPTNTQILEQAALSSISSAGMVHAPHSNHVGQFPGGPAVAHSSFIGKHASIVLPDGSMGPNGLDLTSKQANYSLSSLGGAQTLTITVGGKSEVVDLQTKLTAAELVAAEQVLLTGHQSLKIDSLGVASGGVFTLSPQSLNDIDAAMGNITGLHVAHGVRLIDSVASLQFAGDLVNQGQISVLGQGGAGTLQAHDIINTSGASINAGRGTTLNLIAENTLANSGVISAAGNVNVSAPNVINIDGGLIESRSGNVNFTNPGAFVYTGTGGGVSAVQGNINLNVTGAAGGDIHINGGNFYSRELNVGSTSGAVDIDAEEITGTVNIDACAAHVNAVTPNLILGTMNVTGDPTYYNQGNITISGAFLPTNGADLAIIARGNIVSNGGSLDTSASSGKGGSITLIAGAEFTTSDGSNSGSNDSTTTLTLLSGPGSGFGSVTGGVIDLTGGNGGKAPLASISTSGGGLFGDGGSITMAAFSGSANKSGSVILPKTLNVDSGTSAIGKSGAITIFAGATKGVAISGGNFDSSRGSLGHGKVIIGAQIPSVSNNTKYLDGTLMSGGISGGAVQNSAIQIGNVTTGGGFFGASTDGSLSFGTINTAGTSGPADFSGGNGGQIVMSSGGNITGKNIYSFGGGGGGGSTSGLNGSDGAAGGSAGPIGITAKSGSINISGQINASGGGGGGGAAGGYNGAAGTAGLGGAGGAAANIAITVFKSLTVGGGIFAVDGAAGGNGALSSALNTGNGGGGGGSYGGGGGGGAGNVNTVTGTGSGGGGGGGGLFGGGGASGSVISNGGGTGGRGGGFNGGGAGGVGTTAADDGLAGGKLTGGNGNSFSTVSNKGIGGVLGSGGTAGLPFVFGAGAPGGDVVVANAVSGATLAISNQNGSVGTAKAPLVTLVGAYNLKNTTPASKVGDYFLNNLAGVSLAGVLTQGTTTLNAYGDISIDAPTSCSTLNLTTSPGSNGNIFINQHVQSAVSNFKADGSGDIQAAAGKFVVAINSTFASGNGMIGNSVVPIIVGFFSSTVSANTNNDVFLSLPNDATILKSSSGSGDFTATATGVLTVGGPIQSNNNVVLTGNFGVVVNANVSAGGMGGVVLATTGTGNITEKKGLTLDPGNSGLVEFDFDKGNVGSSKVPFTTNATTVYLIVANAGGPTSAFINDTNTSAISVQSLSNPGNLLVVTSPASGLTAKDLNWSQTNITDTGKTGAIFLTGQIGGGNTVITTDGGDINQPSGLLAGSKITINTKSGNIGKGNSIDLDPASLNHLYINGGKTTDASFACTGTVNLYASTANSIGLVDKTTSINEPINVSSIVVSDASAVPLTQKSGATITASSSVVLLNNVGDVLTLAPILSKAVLLDSVNGQVSYGDKVGTGAGNVTIIAKNAILAGSAKSYFAGQEVVLSGSTLGGFNTLSGSATVLNLGSMGDAFISLNGNKTTSLKGPGSIGGNLTLSSTGALTFLPVAGLQVAQSITMTVDSLTVPAGITMKAMAGNLFLTTTGKGTEIDVQGTMSCTANMRLTTAGTSTINVGAAGNLVGPTMKVVANTINNAGNITIANGFSTITTQKGDFLLNNSGTYGTPNDFSIVAPGKVTITNTGTFSPFLAATTCESITINAGGAVTLPTNLINVHADPSNNGGVIAIQGTSLVHPAGLMTFSANATNAATGNGGRITLFINGKQLINADGTGYKFLANASTMGGDGGQLFVITKGDLSANFANGSVSLNKFGANPNGSSVQFISGGLLQVNGTIDCSGAGTGTGGRVLLDSLSKTTFTLAKGSPLTAKSNGVNGDVLAKDMIIAEDSAVAISAGTTLTSTGGQLFIFSHKIVNDGNVGGASVPSQFVLSSSSGDLSISGGGSWPTALQEQVAAKGNLTIATTNPVLKGVQIVASAGKTLTLNTNTITASPFLSAGSIILVADKLAYSIAMPGPLVLKAQSANVGGTIAVAMRSKTPLTIDSAAAGAINIVATPTGGAPTSGGDVTVLSGGDLIVNLNGLSTNAGNAAIDSKVSLNSGGNLKVNGGWSNFITGAGGDLTLASASTQPFSIGSSAVNGIATAAAISTGTISVTNSKGDVTIGGTDFLTGATSVSVSAGKNITGPLAAEAIKVMSGTIALTSSGGMIGTPNGATIAPLQLSASAVSANAGKGLVNLQSNLAGAVTLGASSAKTFTMQTAQSLTVGAPLAASNVTLKTATSSIVLDSSVGDGTGIVDLNSAVNINQSSGTINAKSLTLAGKAGNSIQTNVGTLKAGFTGNAAINNVGAGLLTLNGVAADNLTITSAGPISVNAAATGLTSVTLNSGGSLTVNATVSSPSVSLNSTNGGLISATKTGVVNAPNFVATSDSGDINLSKGQLKANNLTVGTGGNVVLTDNASAGDVTIASIVLPVKSFTFNGSSSGHLKTNNISTSNGSISIVWNGDSIMTGAGSSLKTNTGNITLQQLSAQGIALGANSTIYASSTKANIGNVTIVVGPIPAKGIVGTNPGNISTSFTGKGQIFFGPAGKLTAGAVASHLNAFDRNILFNSNAAPITLGNNVTITADPPLKPGEVISDHPLFDPAVSSFSASNITVGGVAPASGLQTSHLPLVNFAAGSVASTTNLNVTGANSFLIPGSFGFTGVSAISSQLKSASGIYAVDSRPSGKSARLNNEALLIAPDRDQQIETKFGRLSLKANSLVLVISTDRHLTVFNLDDRKHGSVVTDLEGSRIVLEPGRHLTVSRLSAGNFSAVNPVKFVPHRRLITADCGAYRVHRSEFHLPSMIFGLTQLRELVRSTEPSKRAAAAHMLKTAAILDSLGSGNGERFELYNEDLLTAMAPTAH